MKTGRRISKEAMALITSRQLGNRLRTLRLKRSMGLVQLGEKSGLSAPYLSLIETGHQIPTLQNLAAVAAVFSKDLAYFFEPDQPLLSRTLIALEDIRESLSGGQS